MRRRTFLALGSSALSSAVLPAPAVEGLVRVVEGPVLPEALNLNALYGKFAVGPFERTRFHAVGGYVGGRVEWFATGDGRVQVRQGKIR